MIVVDRSVIASLWVPNDMEELANKVLRKILIRLRLYYGDQNEPTRMCCVAKWQ